MCGITGIIDFNKQSSKEILENMTSTLNHRGPDGYGIELIQENNFQLGLGHRRLVYYRFIRCCQTTYVVLISFSITFNGEIYNYKEIIKDLEQLGHHF